MPTEKIIEVPMAKLVMDPAMQVRVGGLEAEHVAALADEALFEEELDGL